MSDLSPIMKVLVDQAHREQIEKARGLLPGRSKQKRIQRMFADNASKLRVADAFMSNRKRPPGVLNVQTRGDRPRNNESLSQGAARNERAAAYLALRAARRAAPR